MLELSATEAVQLLCSRKITAEAYASKVLARMEETSCLNAWAYVNSSKVCLQMLISALSAADATEREFVAVLYASKACILRWKIHWRKAGVKMKCI